MKESKKQQSDSFLSQELIDESQIQIPIGYEIINKYPLLPPFSYVNILYNSEKSSYLYFVDEARLNTQEKQIFQTLYHLLEESLESMNEKNSSATFDEHLDTILKDNEKMFLAN